MSEYSPRPAIIILVLTTAFCITIVFAIISYWLLTKREGTDDHLTYLITGLVLMFLAIIFFTLLFIVICLICIFGFDVLTLKKRQTFANEDWLNIPCHQRPQKLDSTWSSTDERTTWVYRSNKRETNTATTRPLNFLPETNIQDTMTTNRASTTSSESGNLCWDQPPPTYAEIIFARNQNSLE